MDDVTITFAWECPHCGAAVENGNRGETVTCPECHGPFVAGRE